jgi:hypothetical protein
MDLNRRRGSADSAWDSSAGERVNPFIKIEAVIAKAAVSSASSALK